jgi:hypothetical protein
MNANSVVRKKRLFRTQVQSVSVIQKSWICGSECEKKAVSRLICYFPVGNVFCETSVM